jgi:hypothetical protein
VTTYRRYVDAVAQVAFPIPLTQTRVESRHFGRRALPHQMTDVLTLSGPETDELEVAIWENPAQLELGEWIRTTLPILLSPDRAEVPWHAAGGRVPARLFEYPRTGQQYGRRTAVFAVGHRVVKLTCWNKDDPRAAAAFEQLLEGFEDLR